ncbi:MAG: phage GP46 family protein [Hydrogenovibrio crunogenus]|nr:phage GP46 family protein [Hydrogenovibrio crunogenus]
MSHFSLDAINNPVSNATGMEHAILQSLFNWSKAQLNDPVDKGQNRQGWWSESFIDAIGCRDWTLARSKQTDETLNRAKLYTETALQWLIDKQHATAIDVQCQYQDDRLVRLITVTLTDGQLFEVTL